MKKVFAAVFAAFLFAGALLPAVSALEKAVAVPELNLELSAPEGWYVFTRDMDADDPAFDMFEGFDKEYMDRFFEEGSIYYNAVEGETAGQEIVVQWFPMKKFLTGTTLWMKSMTSLPKN